MQELTCTSPLYLVLVLAYAAIEWWVMKPHTSLRTQQLSTLDFNPWSLEPYAVLECRDEAIDRGHPSLGWV